MALEWLTIGKELLNLFGFLSGIIKKSNAKNKLLLSELNNNLRHYETAKTAGLSYDKLIDLLSNSNIVEARKEGYAFSSVKFGKISAKHIRDARNNRYKGKDCEWLFINISDKIDELKKIKQVHGSLENLKDVNIALQFSILFYKMKLLARFVRS